MRWRITSEIVKINKAHILKNIFKLSLIGWAGVNLLDTDVIGHTRGELPCEIKFQHVVS